MSAVRSVPVQAAEVAALPRAASKPSRSLLREGGWVVLSRLTTAGLSVAWFKALATTLPPAEFGRWSLFTGLVALAGGMMSGALNQGVGRFAHDAARERVVGSLLARGSLLHLGLCALASVAVLAWAWWGGASLGADPLLLAAAVFAVSSLNALFLLASGLANTLRLRALWTAAVGVEGVVRLGLLLAVASWLGASFWAPVAGSLVGAVAAAGLAYLGLRAALPEAFGGDRFGAWDGVARFARPLVLVSLGWWIVTTLNRFVLEGASGVETVALYGVAAGLATSLVGMVEGVVSSTALPVVYSRLAGASEGELRTRGAGVGVVSCQAVLLLTAGLPFLGGPLLRVFATERYESVAWLFGGFVLVEWLRSAAGQMNASFYARLRTDLLVRPLAGGVVLQLLVGAPLAWHFGPAGALAGAFVVFAGVLLLTLRLTPEVRSVAAAWGPWLGRFAACAALGGAGALAHRALPHGGATLSLGVLLAYAAGAGVLALSMKPRWEGVLLHG